MAHPVSQFMGVAPPPPPRDYIYIFENMSISQLDELFREMAEISTIFCCLKIL